MPKAIMIHQGLLRGLFLLAIALHLIDHVHAQNNDQQDGNGDETIVVLLYGKVVNRLDEPLVGAQVQIWQTDIHGQYDHPLSVQDRGALLQDDFQYFGTATTDDFGSFTFTTIRPGLYPARPITHIHYKIWWEGQDVLTSQFYFADENQPFSELLILELLPTSGMSNVFSANKTVVVDLGTPGGFLPATPSQTAGPFYPVVDFFSYGSNLLLNWTNALVSDGLENIDDSQGTSSPSVTPSESIETAPFSEAMEDSSPSATGLPPQGNNNNGTDESSPSVAPTGQTPGTQPNQDDNAIDSSSSASAKLGLAMQGGAICWLAIGVAAQFSML